MTSIYNKDTGCPKSIRTTTTTTNILDEPNSACSILSRNLVSSDKECEDSDKESSASDEPNEKKINFENVQKPLQSQNINPSEISIARSDVATIDSSETETNQQEFNDCKNSTVDDGKLSSSLTSSSSSSSSSTMESALSEYIQDVENASENSHKKMYSNIEIIYGGLIQDIDVRKENICKNNFEENDSKKTKEYSDKEETLEESVHSIVSLRESMKGMIAEKMEDYEKNVCDISREYQTLNKAIESLRQKYNETNEFMRINIKQGQQVEDVKNRMESFSNITSDINKMTLEMQKNVKDLQELTVKVPSFENSFKSIQEEVRKKEEGLKAKYDEEIRNISSKYHEFERKLKLVDESVKKLKEEEMFEYFNQKNQELEKIWEMQVKSEELESKINKLEISLQEHEHKINANNKYDSLIALLEKTNAELQNRFQEEIKESEKNILKHLEEDRTKKLELMIATVEEEAGKVHGRLDIMESSHEVLKKEFKERDAEIVKILEEDNVKSDQIIRDKIKEEMYLYTTENDAKVQRIHETIESYEERMNKLADTSFELETAFNEEIQKGAEKRIRVMEEENRELTEHIRELKYKLEAKETECSECKVECDRNDVIITGLGQNKIELENKVRCLKSERKRLEAQVKEMEEMERTYKMKLEENSQVIKTMKIDFEKIDQRNKIVEERNKTVEADKFWYKGWLDISFVIVVTLLIIIFYLLSNPLDNNWYFIASLGPAPQ